MPSSACILPCPPTPTPFPYTTLFRSGVGEGRFGELDAASRADDPRLNPKRHDRDGPKDLERDPSDLALFAPIEPLHLTADQSGRRPRDRKSTRLNSSHLGISYAVFCLHPTVPTHSYPLSLHDALPIWCRRGSLRRTRRCVQGGRSAPQPEAARSGRPEGSRT